jgi:hypothetical protein
VQRCRSQVVQAPLVLDVEAAHDPRGVLLAGEQARLGPLLRSGGKGGGVQLTD